MFLIKANTIKQKKKDQFLKFEPKKKLKNLKKQREGVSYDHYNNQERVVALITFNCLLIQFNDSLYVPCTHQIISTVQSDQERNKIKISEKVT